MSHITQGAEMNISSRLLRTTLVGIKNGTVRPDLAQWALLEEAGLALSGTLTPAGWLLIDPPMVRRTPLDVHLNGPLVVDTLPCDGSRVGLSADALCPHASAALHYGY